MSDYIVAPSTLSGELTITPSKSQTLRAILFGALARGKTEVYNPLPSPDTKAMIEGLQTFGIPISQKENRIEITGSNGILGAADNVIDAGNSGIVFRFLSAVSALSQHPIVITGDLSLRSQRPIGPLLQGLSQLGARAVSTKGDGYAPVIIEGPLKGGKAVISGEDSQPVSGLLIAAIFAKGPTELEVRNPGEKPWVQMTLDWFNRLGLEYFAQDYSRYRVKGNCSFDGFSYSVPGDFSTAAFPIVAALITRSEVTIKNLDFADSQGDKKAIEVFQKMGADITIDREKKSLHVGKNTTLKGIRVDINDFIDVVTPLAVLGCFAEGKTEITNAGIARTKECDRLKAITTELRKMGAVIKESEDGLEIHNSVLKGDYSLKSYQDHRMAMALSVAALAADGDSRIAEVDCIDKTYPFFLRDFCKLGAGLREER